MSAQRPVTLDRYVVALGSNMRVPGIGSPRAVIRSAFDALSGEFEVSARSRIIDSAPVGPSQRRYANAAALIVTAKRPSDVLHVLQAIERRYGRRRLGQRWRARPLDLDIVLWSGGAFDAPGLTIPHPLWRIRPFVAAPAAMVAPDWRDVQTGLTVRQTSARLDRRLYRP